MKLVANRRNLQLSASSKKMNKFLFPILKPLLKEHTFLFKLSTKRLTLEISTERKSMEIIIDSYIAQLFTNETTI